MNIAEGRETRTLDARDMAKMVSDFHRDALSAAPAVAAESTGLFSASSSGIGILDRNQTALHGPTGLPMTSLVKSTGEIPVTMALSKRPDSIITTAKQMAKAIRPTSTGKNSRMIDSSKMNGSLKHGRISGFVSPADGSLTGHLVLGKSPPIEMRPIQPAVTHTSFTASSAPNNLPLAFYRNPNAITPPGAAVPPLLFMQENVTRFQTAAISIAPLQTPSGQSSANVSPLRFPLPSIPKPSLKPRKRSSPPEKWLATIKPDLKPKPSLDVAAAHSIRPTGSLDVVANGFGISPVVAAYQKRALPEGESVVPKKRSRKKYNTEGSPASATSSNSVNVQPGFARLMEGYLPSLLPIGSALPGMAAMVSGQDVRSEPAETACPGRTPSAGPVTAFSSDASSSQPFSGSSDTAQHVSTTPGVSTENGHELRTVSTGSIISSVVQQAFSPSHPNENDAVTDLLCHDAMSSTLSPSPPAIMVRAPVPASEAENGAFRKKTRLIYDSGVRKFQQINHETASDHSVNGTDLRTVTVGEKPVLVNSNTNRSSSAKSITIVDAKPQKKTRKPRSDKGISPRLPKMKKEKAVVTTTKVVPVKLELKRRETEEQTLARMKRLAHKWSSLSEDSIRWLVATKSVDQLKVIRWLRLVDRAFVQAESAKNFEKMERLRDSKIQAIMDLEKLQAPFEPRLMHFLHPDDLEKKNRLIKKYFTGQKLPTKDVKWLKDHYDRVRFAEAALPGLGASTDSSLEKPTHLPCALSARSSGGCSTNGTVPHPGNERGNFQLVVGDNEPSTSSSAGTSDASRSRQETSCPNPQVQPLDALSVQTAHQFVRKFPDSTRAMIEVDRDDLPCAVLLLIQQPNRKAVHIKKLLKRPANGFSTTDEAFSSAMSCLDHLVMKFLCIPSFPMLVRYPLFPGLVNNHLPTPSAGTTRASVLSFNRENRGWQTIQYVESPEIGIPIGDTINDRDFDLANDIMAGAADGGRPSLLQDYRRVLPDGDTYQSLGNFARQITARRPVDLTAIANDPVEQRRWLCWELRHVSKQYWDLDSCQQAREAWYGRFVERIKTVGEVPDATVARALRFMEAARDGMKKPKASTVLVNKTIKMGEQVKDVLESYKKERPMTRRKKAKMSQLA